MKIELSELILQLRDYNKRFIFQGGSEFACSLADEIERLESIATEAVGMLDDAATLSFTRVASAPDAALQWFARRGELRAALEKKHE